MPAERWCRNWKWIGGLGCVAAAVSCCSALRELCFAWYAQQRRAFTADPALLARAEASRAELQTITAQLSAPPGAAPVFMGRLGVPRAPLAGPRSVRKDLHRLMQAAPSQR